MEEEKLKQMGCSAEVYQKALGLTHKAKVATKPGTGRELGELSTALVPICALMASEELNSSDVTIDAAQAASCLKKADFNKAQQIIRAALGSGSTSKKAETYTSLAERYVHHTILRALLVDFCHQTEEEAKKLKMKMTKDTVCTVFYWVCASAKLKELPESADYCKDQAISHKLMAPQCTKLTKNHAALRKRITEETKAKTASRTPSPTKRGAATPTATPRRSGRQPQRELLTKESVKKASAAKAAGSLLPLPIPEEDDSDDDEGSLPETPTKRRRLDPTTASKSSPRSLFPPVASSSRVRLDEEYDVPQTPRRNATLPSRSSPLKRAILPQEEDDVSMDQDQAPEASDASEDEDDDDGDPTNEGYTRFRPVYVEQRQWNMRGKRVRRLLRLAGQKKAEYFQVHGNPFELLKAQ
ncbi:hypothetical protein D9611_009551 [Ephemerocybe angulata]|uniref:Origin recognition complex subunit 6 n=1 Tax=Ephemerocybe angulata TaxID=980116 RepID=A0A8H5AVD0_9AGAR|nr:hypothetical protein D9611_009551 [Tulosesus angulatus]